ncbi:MAG: septal ring lytic transglycosylase RlpA family protein [Verrucomicrobia bacterium]|nr:septal ring lytic transglycosylase RlpA family protein [Verrucomicrobiota bacterium]
MRRSALQALWHRLCAGLALLPSFAAADGPLMVARGTASYYRAGYAAVTASGEIYHPELFTAAHATLPMGTWVRVTHLGTGQSALVRVNDRSPFVAGNVIDVSMAAAEKLGLLAKGYAEVSLSLLETVAPPGGRPSATEEGGVARLTPVSGLPPAVAGMAVSAGVRPMVRVQFSTHHELSSANREQAVLRDLGVETTIYRRDGARSGEPLFRLVTTGGFGESGAAERWLEYIKRKTGGYPEACVVP